MSQGSQGQDADGSGGEITWVGEQRLMDGYCGRACGGAVTTTPAPTATQAPAASARTTGTPVASVRGRARRRDLIVRVAPPRPTPNASVPQEAA